jgi:hypothetical protein
MRPELLKGLEVRPFTEQVKVVARQHIGMM